MDEPIVVPGELPVVVPSFVSAPLPASSRRPIRPVGFAGSRPSTLALLIATILKLAMFAYGIADLYDLSRYDWMTYVRPHDAYAYDVPLDLAEVPANEQGKLTDPAQVGARLEKFVHDLVWLVPAFVLVLGIELGAILWWQFRTHHNLASLGSMGLRFDSVSALMWWFAPIYCWWMPLVVVQEIWRGSDPGVPAGDARAWRVKRTSAVAGLWWSLRMIAKALYWFALFMFLIQAWSIVTPLELTIIAMATTAASLVAQIDLVRRVSKRQAALYGKRMRAVEKAVAAGEPVVNAIEEGVQPSSEELAATSTASTSADDALELGENDLLQSAERGVAAEDSSDESPADDKVVEGGDVIELGEAHEAPGDETPPTMPN